VAAYDWLAIEVIDPKPAVEPPGRSSTESPSAIISAVAMRHCERERMK
jgi:hypothetical protein